MKRYTMFFALVSVLFLAACDREEVPDVQAPQQAIETRGAPLASPPPPAEGKTVVADGQLASPYPQLALSFGGGVSGDIVALHIKAGDTLKAGDILAELDTTELARTVENVQLTLERAIIDEAHAQVQWERKVADAEQALLTAYRALTGTVLQASNTTIVEARAALDRTSQAETDAKKAYDTPLFGEWTPDDVRENQYRSWQAAIQERQMAEMRLTDALNARAGRYLDQDSRVADVAQAERNRLALQDGVALNYARAIEDAQRELDKAQRALEHAQLTAPWDAIVLSVDVAPKATVNVGTPVATLLSVADGLRFITQNLSEQHVAAVRPGQAVSIILRTYPERTFTGTVEAIIPQTETQQATDARFTVRVKLAATDVYLLPGLTGRAEILAEGSE